MLDDAKDEPNESNTELCVYDLRIVLAHERDSPFFTDCFFFLLVSFVFVISNS